MMVELYDIILKENKKMDKLERKLLEVECIRENDEQNKINEEASYANVLKRKNKEELLIINCEEQNDFKKLEEGLKCKINPTELEIGVGNIENMNKGKIGILCESKKDADTLKKEVLGL
ncbi:hypothetical protein WA026_012454 [Henosepilachna vigintioctopunctata]|uniref:Ribosomal protein L7Ae/L30e/S12e/Gadd45 domain-containing protein n=1 Tax=Henosepilachna vigintioctopunctata TaxID=420089 RepID=A0AAW1V1D9_9CUCU